jgi:protein SCO1/2
MTMRRLTALLLFAILVCPCHVAGAATARDVKDRVGIDEHPGAELPLSARLRDEHGKTVRLGELLGRRPAILALVYFDCPNLCNVTLNSLVGSLSHIDLQAGRDFDVFAVSFDSREGALQAAERHRLLSEHYPTSANWRFLAGDAKETAKVADAVGFRFFWDPAQSQFAHPAAIVVITPQGRIARYFGGVEFPPPELRWALVQAGKQRITFGTDRLWLLCYHYEALIGQHSASVLTGLRVLGFAAVAGLALLIRRLARNTP